MAESHGSTDEFIKYFGTSYLTNLIQQRTRPYKRGICEGYGRAPHPAVILDSAHVHGRERLIITSEVLSRHVDDGSRLCCDISAVIEEIWQAHYPISQTFKFLCRDCHREYDQRVEQLPVQAGARLRDRWRGKRLGRDLQIVFVPADESEFTTLLLKHRQAYVTLHKADGTVRSSLWRADRFTASSNLRNNLGSGYLRGWREKQLVKAVFSIERPKLAL